MTLCCVPGCGAKATFSIRGDLSLCTPHGEAWEKSGELRRALRAFQDYVDRAEREHRAGAGGVAIPTPAATQPEEMPPVVHPVDDGAVNE